MRAKTQLLIRSNANPHIVAVFVLTQFLLLFALGALFNQEWGPAVFLTAIPGGTGVAWLFSEYAAKKYRLRLLADGIRVTDWGRTREFRNPELLRDGRLANSLIELNANGQSFQINLERFEWRDQAIILEHLSQFLTPEQQAKHGDRWAKLYARRITVRKPADPWEQFFSTWRLICITAGCCIFCVPILLVLPIYAEGFSPSQIPGMQKMLYCGLAIAGVVPLVMLFLFGFVLIPIPLGQYVRRPCLEAMIELEWRIKDSQLGRQFWTRTNQNSTSKT